MLLDHGLVLFLQGVFVDFVCFDQKLGLIDRAPAVLVIWLLKIEHLVPKLDHFAGTDVCMGLLPEGLDLPLDIGGISIVEDRAHLLQT